LVFSRISSGLLENTEEEDERENDHDRQEDGADLLGTPPADAGRFMDMPVRALCTADPAYRSSPAVMLDG
jgi:hypothetical protein